MKSKSQTTINQEALECPACNAPIFARYAIELDTAGVDPKASDITVKGKVVGFEIGHNCIPKVTR